MSAMAEKSTVVTTQAAIVATPVTVVHLIILQ
jgi:hypothetical protein